MVSEGPNILYVFFIVKDRKESSEYKRSYTKFFKIRETSCQHLFQLKVLWNKLHFSGNVENLALCVQKLLAFQFLLFLFLPTTNTSAG